LGLIVYIGGQEMLTPQKKRNKEKWQSQQVTRNRRQNTIEQFKRVQREIPQIPQIPHRPADDHIIRIPNNHPTAPHLTQPRPAPGQQKKYDLRKNDPAVRQVEQMQQQMQNQASENDLDVKWSNRSKSGMSPDELGGINTTVQQRPYGNGVAESYNPYDSEPVDGSKLPGSIVAEKAHERSFQEGGLSADEINVDIKEGLGTPQGAPKPCQINLDFKAG
jgi:hypothetical protein